MPQSVLLFATETGLVLEADQRSVQAPAGFTIDRLFSHADPVAFALKAFADGAPLSGHRSALRAPVQSQEVWAAGVTYLRSKTARIEESKDAGGGSFYDRVYEADRPELFFKSTPHRVAAPDSPVRIRHDSKWNVPEPELTLAINSRGQIFGYTLGNDMSSRDIEGENPLYLPQAKVWDRSAAVGPGIRITRDLPTADAKIELQILRAGAAVFSGETTVGRIKRPLPSLADWLYRDNSFPYGCYLMTGTGIVPPDTFTLQPQDEIRISLAPVGTLVNTVLL